MKTKLLILMSLLLICSGLFVSCKESISPFDQKSPPIEVWFYNDPFIEGIDNGGGRTGPAASRPLTAEQSAWISTAKNIMENELGITDFEEDNGKEPTVRLPILNECQGQAYRDYFQTVATAIKNYDSAKADCLRNVGYPATIISVYNGQLDWKAFIDWVKGNKGAGRNNVRSFMYTIAIGNLVAWQCIESKLTDARDIVDEANREFAVKYARCK
jgi:hypothetical protein